MHLGGNNQKFDYFMGSHKLEAVSQEKDLGVWITDNLKPSTQCQYAYSEASRALGLIGRTISFESKDVLIIQDSCSSPSGILCVGLVTILC